MADKKKTFSAQLGSAQFNPAMQFISSAPQQSEEEPKPKQGRPAKPQSAYEKPQDPPDGFRMNPMYIEKKTRRLQLLLKPSVYDAIRERADREGVSVNEMIGSILETAVK